MKKKDFWTKEKIIKMSKKNKNKIKNITYYEYQNDGYKKLDLPNHNIIMGKFGTIKKFYKSIGFRFKNKKTTLTKQEIIKIAKQNKEKLKNMTTGKFKSGEYKKIGLCSYATICCKFHTMDNFYKKIGFRFKSNTKTLKQQIKDQIEIIIIYEQVIIK